MTDDDQKMQSRKTGFWLLFSLLAFFITFASVDAFFIYKALSTHTGTVSETPYEDGLKLSKIKTSDGK